METNKLKSKVKEEFMRMMLLTLYLFALFGALTTYKRLILAQHDIHFADYGTSLISALVLAKAILIGSAFRIGSRFNDRPLIVGTLYKTLCFSLLMLAVGIAERLIKGWWSGETTGAIVVALGGKEKWEILARVMMMFIALIPLFAFWETHRVLGGNSLYQLFFEKRTPGGDSKPAVACHTSNFE
jgi:hypothetical protein